MAKAVRSAFKWVGGIVSDGLEGIFGIVGKPILRALTPKLPEIDTSSAQEFRANPDAGIPYAIGITGTAGTYVYATVGEAKNRNLLFYAILSGGGPIDGFVSFKADGTTVVFDGPDTPESGPYRHLMWQRRQLGTVPSPALLPPNTLDAGVLAEWSPNHKTSGYAASWLVLGADQKAYSTGVPAPIWKIRGVKVYDWRLDSTYPGGLGPQRINDPSTWAFSENPAVHAVAWCLGRYQNGKRVLGLGCFLSQLVMAKYNEWANVCDANGWKVGGIVYSTDTKWQILKAICQAGGAYPIPLGSKISVIFNAPRVSIATLTGADIDGEPNIVGTQLRRDRFNRAVPRYRSEDNGWQIVPAAPVEVPEFAVQDGGVRTKELEWPLVQNVDQASQLAAYGICNSREIGPIELPLIPPWMGLEPGDCITLNEPEFGLTSQKLVIVGRNRDLSTAERSVTCVTETDSKHAFCLGLTGTPPPLPSLSAVDTLPAAPDPGTWVVSGGTLAGPGGSLPALILTGAVNDPNAIAIIVEYREILDTDPVTYGDWVSTEWPISSTRIEVGGVKAGANYQVRVRYRYARNTEDPDNNTDLGTVVVGGILPSPDVIDAINEASGDARAAGLAVIEEATNRALADDLIDRALHTADGLPLGPTVSEQMTITDNMVETVALIAVKTADGAAVIEQRDTVIVDEETGETRAERDALLLAQDAANTAAIGAETVARTSADAAEALARLALQSDFETNVATVNSALLTLSDADSALSASLLALSSEVDDNKASADSSIAALVDDTEALSTSLLALTAEFDGLDAAVTVQGAAISGLQGRTASYLTKVAAAGADPAYVSMSSDSTAPGGVDSYIALVAKALLLYNISGGTLLKVMEAIGGFVHFANPIYIEAGANRLILGPAFGAGANLLLWYGPDSYDDSSATSANAIFALTTAGGGVVSPILTAPQDVFGFAEETFAHTDPVTLLATAPVTVPVGATKVVFTPGFAEAVWETGGSIATLNISLVWWDGSSETTLTSAIIAALNADPEGNIVNWSSIGDSVFTVTSGAGELRIYGTPGGSATGTFSASTRYTFFAG